LFAYTPDGRLRDRLLRLVEIPSLVLEGGSVFDGHGWMEGAIVVLEHGRIVYLGSALTASTPPDAEHISFAGQWLLPGLVDCWVHLIGDRNSPDDRDVHCFGNGFGPALRLYRATQDAHRLLAGGITSVAHMGGCEPEYIAGVREAVGQGLVIGPTIVTAGRALPSANGNQDWIEISDRKGALRKAVRERLVEGADLGLPPRQTVTRSGQHDRSRHTLLVLWLTTETPEDGATYSDADLHVIVEEAHQIGATVACCAASLQQSKAALRAGVDLLLLGPCEPDADCVHMLTSGKTAWAPALCARQEQGMISDALKSAVKAVHVGGGMIVAGTSWRGEDDYRFGAEINALMDAGLSPTAALAAGTTNGAQLLGLGRGLLQPGTNGSLVILDNDPSSEPKILGDPRHISLILYAMPTF
jgi:imidazolonepropionase-like amidohydrolase